MSDKIVAKAPTESQLDRSEAFNNSVLESSLDCLKILDTEGRIQYMNFNGLCQMEIDDFSRLKNQLWWELWGPENVEIVKNAVSTAMNGQATEFTAFCATAKGTPKWWHVNVNPVGTAADGIYQILSVSRDITDQKMAEEEIKTLNALLEEKVKIRTEELFEKNKELEKSNKQLTLFNYIACHDLQEPLRKIQMYSNSILTANNEIDETHFNFSRILKATARMRNLVESLSKFSNLKNSKVVFEKCDLNKILLDVLENSQHVIEQKKAVIHSDKLPTIKGSEVLITQVLINILENALKYSKEEEIIKINISCEVVRAVNPYSSKVTTADEFYAISIADNGIGFDEEYKVQIFEAFKRLHNSSQYTGSGIGLALCKMIVEKHGGWIEATGLPNQGATFTLYFKK